MSDDEPVNQPRLLDLNDRNSPTWRKLRETFATRLQELRARNDNDMDETATAKLRGEIAQVKYLLALGEQDPATEADED